MDGVKKIAIIGRPNVGKSTLFNSLVGKKCAIVSDISGMTRDRNVMHAYIAGMRFDVIDTAGVVIPEDSDISSLMNKQSLKAISDADIIFFTVDVKNWNFNIEFEVANWIRVAFKKLQKQKPVVVVANKSESLNFGNDEIIKLGFGNPIYISSAHKIGFAEIYNTLSELFYDLSSNNEQADLKNPDIKLAIIGRPNAGKSTLINKILNEDRLVTSSIAGTTRDSIKSYFTFKNYNIEIVDTAGNRKNKKANSMEEKLSVASGERAIRESNIAILVIDTNTPFEVRDLQLANFAISEGKGLIIALNKCDLFDVTNLNKIVKNSTEHLDIKLANSYMIIPISGLTGKNINMLLSEVIRIYLKWNKDIPTKKLNNWLMKISKEKKQSEVVEKCPKLSFIRQVSSRPPSFLISGTRINMLQNNYIKYLEKNFRATFNMDYIPIRMVFKYKANPYKKN